MDNSYKLSYNKAQLFHLHPNTINPIGEYFVTISHNNWTFCLALSSKKLNDKYDITSPKTGKYYVVVYLIIEPLLYYSVTFRLF